MTIVEAKERALELAEARKEPVYIIYAPSGLEGYFDGYAVVRKREMKNPANPLINESKIVYIVYPSGVILDR